MFFHVSYCFIFLITRHQWSLMICQRVNVVKFDDSSRVCPCAVSVSKYPKCLEILHPTSYPVDHPSLHLSINGTLYFKGRKRKCMDTLMSI
ncbi:hypothetical protein BD289DRAFT_250919 [Coniella lustricola]|uniref:Secreted protein n=1 Tax=Coniella lustricola TaxID=2025994 RepID=A0A2T3A8G7_9PEZI|nr:hypothetical protein BD289DRAFT_250919 [Coniella lustricola]